TGSPVGPCSSRRGWEWANDDHHVPPGAGWLAIIPVRAAGALELAVPVAGRPGRSVAGGRGRTGPVRVRAPPLASAGQARTGCAGAGGGTGSHVRSRRAAAGRLRGTPPGVGRARKRGAVRGGPGRVRPRRRPRARPVA